MFDPGLAHIQNDRSRPWAIALGVLLIGTLGLAAGCSDDDPVTPPPTNPNTPLNATLDAAQLVPPLTNISGSGTGTFILNANKDELSFRISFGAMTGTVASAHFHNAAPAAIGPVVRNIIGDLTGETFEGIWKATDTEPFSPAMAQALLDGDIYVNLHTNAFPTGEIRGQVLTIPSGTAFHVALDASQLVPPPAGVTGTGTGSLILNAAETELSYSISYGGLTAILPSADIHNGALGATGPIVRGISKDLTNTTYWGVWSNTSSEPLTPALVAELKKGNLYVQINTSINPNGEIRGQVILAQ